MFNRFEFYRDGIGFGGYSFRISNLFSNGKNGIKNVLRLAGSIVGAGTVAARSIGFSSSNNETAYVVRTSAGVNLPNLSPFAELIQGGECNVTNVINNYSASELTGEEIYDVGDWPYDIKLMRGFTQPIQVGTEDCIKGLIGDAYSSFTQSVGLQKEIITCTVAAVGLFAVGYKAVECYQKQNKSMRVEESLNDEIIYQNPSSEF